MRSRVFLFFFLLVCASPAAAQINRPILISQPGSTRALAFESPTYLTEPFGLNSRIAWGEDRRTRVMLFVMNLKLAEGEDLSVVTADAEDFRHEMYTLKVEALRPLPGREWVSAIVVRLSDDLRDVGDVLVRVSYRGISSNRVRIGILHVGGGPPDDTGAVPTPAPSYLIGGRVLEKGLALAGVQLTLTGTQSSTASTDNSGAFSFIVAQQGDYTVTPSAPFYTFSPQAITINSISENLEANFVANRITYSVSGQLRDESANPVPFTRLTISRNSFAQTTTTDAQGNYTFTAVEAGYSYTLAPDNSIFDFAPQAIQSLTSNQRFDFQAARRRYIVLVKLAEQDSTPVADFPVKLSGNSETRTGRTNYQGVYIFTDVEAGHEYVIAPESDNVFAFLHVIRNLSGDEQASLDLTRRQYTIGGRVLEGGRPVAGATVSLSGEANLTATTDASGFYLFSDLQAGRDYMVAASKEFFKFEPESSLIQSLENYRETDFQGTPTYSLRGRVTDKAGSGLAGIIITLAGAESGVYQTGTDGSYAISVHTTGDYSLSVSSVQNYFTFTPPAQNLKAVDGDRVVDFKAMFQPETDPFYVLEFDGTPKTVDCDFFWPDDRPLGHFFWEVWGQPDGDAGSRYMISDGYGGAHAILFGFGVLGRTDPGHYELFGDFWSGTEIIYFGGDEGPAVGEWGHFGVGWDGRQIITYFNGVPVGRVSYSGQRWCAGYRSGAGKLLLGGSDHNNLSGRLAQVRGYEDVNPREATSVTAAFVPESLFSPGGNYLGNFFRPSQTIADLSGYYQGQMHRGRLRGTLSGVINECPECPKPEFVIDPTAPTFMDAEPVNLSAPVPAAPASAPADALIFDSFSRANSTYAMGRGGLGITEGGRSGVQRWRALQTNALERFGILNGRAVVLANETALAWVPTGSTSANVDIQVQRRVGEWGSGYDTSIAFRVVDEGNFFFAYTTGGENDPADQRKLTVGYYLNGVRTELVGDLSVPGYWTRLEVISHNDGLIKIMTDQGFVYSINSSVLAGATGAGLFNNGPGLGLLNRWDNFTVYDAP